MDLKEKIRSIENFPEEGVIFRDITTLLKEGDALREAIDQIQTNLDGVDFDLILGRNPVALFSGCLWLII